MNTSVQYTRCTGIVALSVTVIFLVTGITNAAEPLSKEQIARMQTMGTRAFGIQWKGELHGAVERGVNAVSDGTTTLTSRGERTFIIHNKKATAEGDATSFRGKDAEFKQRGMKILNSVGAQSKEVEAVKVLQQMTQTGVLSKEGMIKPQAAVKGRRTLLVTRHIDDIPVLSSRMLLNLDARSNIAFLELNWPAITEDTILSARRLQSIAHQKFQPPVMEGAKVERVQAVILHSPAVAFYSDQVAALQVIYQPEQPAMGKKPVRYVDGEGRDVKLPRAIDRIDEKPVKR